MVVATVESRGAVPARPARCDITFSVIECATYGGWTVDGPAFGA
jgi:hypothetical protein